MQQHGNSSARIGRDVRRIAGSLVVVLLAGLMLQPEGARLAAQTKALRTKKDASIAGGPADYTSKNFLLHTDMSAEEAKDLLKKLETMLDLISKYWARPPSGVIEMYVVRDLKNWPAGALDPRGAESIENGGGITMSDILTNGEAFVTKSAVYAVADRGTPQHEAVHAYCHHTFGTAGPVWYAEGMAEMGQYWVEGDKSVNCHEVVVQYLKSVPPKDLLEIVDTRQRTGDSWQNYAWRWALCHLLANNPNYAARFRPLGLELLQKKRGASFENTYGSMSKEISFEYVFFLEHFDRGYRVDLCSWDWKSRFQTLRTGSPLTVKVDAGRGWQASKLTVTDDQEYEYSAAGTWQTDKEGGPVTAEGSAGGTGKLVGVIFNDYKLSEPFELGAYGSFKPPMEGDLFLRCQDKWNELADNKGRINVRLKVKGKGNPLPMPKEETATADANEEPAPESAAKPAKSIKPRPSPKSKSAGKDSGSVKSSD